MPTKVRDLFDWESPTHLMKEYPREFFSTLIVICILLSLIFVFFQEWFAIGVVWPALFLFYALTKTQAQMVEHRITTQGIVSLNRSYLWAELGAFWFIEKDNTVFLHVATGGIPGQLVIIIDKEDKEIIRDTLAHYLPYIEVWEKSLVEKISDWVSAKFPVQKTVSTSNNPPTQTSTHMPTNTFS